MSIKGKIDPFILGIIAVSAFIITGVLLTSYHTTPKNKLTTYGRTETERPSIKVNKTQIDLGVLKVSDKKVEEITLENTGKKVLQITNVYTSCDCTSAQLVINGKESPIFSMHNNPAWMGEIDSGKKATLMAIYEPYKMPVQGAVERTIFFKTNDPENPEIEIHFTAKVE